MNSYYYRLADIVIRINCPFDYCPTYSYMKDFVIQSNLYDYDFDFVKIDDIHIFLNPDMREVSRLGKYIYYLDNNGQEYCFHTYYDYIYAVTIHKKNKGYCYYSNENILIKNVNEGYYLENYIGIESILMKFNAMSLHSCHVDYQNQGILFSAPSGTGKSTQGQLWKENLNAMIINGDRTIIRKKDEQWYAYGAPFCGTSGIHINSKERLKAIIIIRQYDSNIISQLKMIDKMKLLYSELTIHHWNSKYVEQAFQWIDELLQEVEILFYQCNKNKEAALFLKSYLIERGVIDDQKY